MALEGLDEDLLGVAAVAGGVFGLDGQFHAPTRPQRHVDQIVQRQDVVVAGILGLHHEP